MQVPEYVSFLDCILVLISSRGLTIVTAIVLAEAPAIKGIHIGWSAEIFKFISL